MGFTYFPPFCCCLQPQQLALCQDHRLGWLGFFFGCQTFSSLAFIFFCQSTFPPIPVLRREPSVKDMLFKKAMPIYAIIQRYTQTDKHTQVFACNYIVQIHMKHDNMT